MKILWDGAKSASNRKKHGLSFEQAGELFLGGADWLEIYDDAHSTFEDRFLAIGPVESGIVVVVYSEPEDGVLRLISARRATRQEAKRYAEFARGRQR
jgi:uncharacterized DUF497 family protein